MSISADVDTTPLDEDDKFEVIDHLKDLKASCYKLGTALRLKDDALECIKRESADNAEALIKIVSSWLKLNYNWQRFGKPTWKALVEAVASSIGGNNTALAMEIAEKHRAAASPVNSAAQPSQQSQVSNSASIADHNSRQPVASADSSTSLEPITYSELCNDLKDVAAKWYVLGIQLRFQTAALKEIQANVNQQVSKVDHCFLSVLEAWKETKPESFNKKTLVTALRNISENGLAGQIERKADFKMDMQSLTKSLESCKPKYFNLGIQLGLDFSLIKGFQSYSGDCNLCLSTLLQEYMFNMSPDVEEVCQAVKQVGRNDLAKDLRENRYKGRKFLCKKWEE